MSDSPKPTGWWHTLPGLLTGVAAVVTAVSGLIALLYQQGVLGSAGASRESTPTAGPVTQSVPSTTPPPPAQGSADKPPAAGARPWAEAVAVLTLRDGQSTRVRAASFRHCISVGEDLTLDSGQAVPFDKMTGFDVQRADAPTTAGAKASLVIHLLDGSQLRATMDANCDLFGSNDLGRFTTYFDKLQSVRFER